MITENNYKWIVRLKFDSLLKPIGIKIHSPDWLIFIKSLIRSIMY